MKRINRPAFAALALVLAGCSAPALAQSEALADFGSCAKPHYPEADLQAKHEGTVSLEFLVKADGKVADSKVAQTSGFPSMDEAARSALVKCRFKPATKDGKAIDKWTKVQYVWSLK